MLLDISVPSGLGAGGLLPGNVPCVRVRVRPGPILGILSSTSRSLCDRRTLVGWRSRTEVRSSCVSFTDDANNDCEPVEEIRFAWFSSLSASAF